MVPVLILANFKTPVYRNHTCYKASVCGNEVLLYKNGMQTNEIHSVQNLSKPKTIVHSQGPIPDQNIVDQVSKTKGGMEPALAPLSSVHHMTYSDILIQA